MISFSLNHLKILLKPPSINYTAGKKISIRPQGIWGQREKVHIPILDTYVPRDRYS